MSVVFPTSELNPLTAMIEGPFITVKLGHYLWNRCVGTANSFLLQKNDENYIAEPAPKQSSHLILKTISYESRRPF